MTCCFIENDVSFFSGDGLVIFPLCKSMGIEYGNIGKLICKNTYNNPLSRVRVRTHNRSFMIFAVTSVTDFFLICYNTRDYPNYGMNFNKMRRMPLKKSTVRPSKNVYFAANLSSISPYFPSYLPPKCDTCDSKKTTSLLEGVRIRVRERLSSYSGYFL